MGPSAEKKKFIDKDGKYINKEIPAGYLVVHN